MPAEWIPRWRGRSSTSAASSATSGGTPPGPPPPGPPATGSISAPGSTASCSAAADERPAPVPGVDARRPGVHLLGGEAERLAHVAHGRARPVRDDVGHLCRVAAAVALVHVLDHLFAPLRLDVHVDVRRAVACRRQEALEQQTEVDRVDVGDAERVTDGRVGRRAAPLAVDVQPPAHLRDVPHDEEVAGEAELADHVELVLDLLPRPRHPLALGRPVARQGPLVHQLAQVALLVHARRARGSRAAAAPPGAGRTRRPARARPPARPRRANGRSAASARPRERRQATGAGGSHPSSSASGRRARTAASVVARRNPAGVA